jgi:hypothetical protein
MNDFHPTKRLRSPGGERADIDVLLVPLIEALWQEGYETIGCCQDIGESAGTISDRFATLWSGYVLLEMPVADTVRFIDVIKDTEQFWPHMHWAADSAWKISIQVIPLDDQTIISPWAQMYFPADHLDDLVNVITG